MSDRRLLSGKQLRDLRGSRSLSEISAATGLSRATISLAERGRESRISTFLALAEVYAQRIVLEGGQVYLDDGMVVISLKDAIEWVEGSPVPLTLNLDSRIVAASPAVAEMLGIGDQKALRGVDPSPFLDLHGEQGERGVATVYPVEGEEFQLSWRRSEWWIEGRKYELVEGQRL